MSEMDVLLRRVRFDAFSMRPTTSAKRPGQRQRRLSLTEVAELIKEYESGLTVKGLAQGFGVHRVTVTALPHRH